MCFYVQPIYRNVQKSRCDVVCWKVLRYLSTSELFVSVVQGYPYVRGVLQPRIPIELYKSNWPTYIWVEEGYHAYTTQQRAYAVSELFIDRVVVRCVVPAGTRWYYNARRRELVAEQIIVEEIEK